MRQMMVRLALSVVMVITAGAAACAADGPPNGRGAGGPPWARGSSGSGPRPLMLFQIFDADEDGALTEDEVPGPIWTRLSAADLDEDGAVTRDEIIAHLGARFRQGRAEGGRPAK